MTLADIISQVIIGWIIFFIVLCFIFSKLEKRKWNNGICIQCGKPWRYKSRNKKGRIYMCDNNHYCHIKYGQDNW